MNGDGLTFHESVTVLLLGVCAIAFALLIFWLGWTIFSYICS